MLESFFEGSLPPLFIAFYTSALSGDRTATLSLTMKQLWKLYRRLSTGCSHVPLPHPLPISKFDVQDLCLYTLTANIFDILAELKVPLQSLTEFTRSFLRNDQVFLISTKLCLPYISPNLSADIISLQLMRIAHLVQDIDAQLSIDFGCIADNALVKLDTADQSVALLKGLYHDLSSTGISTTRRITTAEYAMRVPAPHDAELATNLFRIVFSIALSIHVSRMMTTLRDEGTLLIDTLFAEFLGRIPRQVQALLAEFAINTQLLFDTEKSKMRETVAVFLREHPDLVNTLDTQVSLKDIADLYPNEPAWVLASIFWLKKGPGNLQ